MENLTKEGINDIKNVVPSERTLAINYKSIICNNSNTNTNKIENKLQFTIQVSQISPKELL